MTEGKVGTHPVAPEMELVAPAAAVRHGDHEEIGGLLADLPAWLRDGGVRIGGLWQRRREAVSGGRPRMELIDVETGDIFPISLDLGPGSQACCIDPAGIASAGVALRRALARRPEILLVNRFGALETERQGFASEMIEAIASGIPLLTVVADRYAREWLRLVEDTGVLLAPTRERVEGWVAAVLARPEARTNRPIPARDAADGSPR